MALGKYAFRLKIGRVDDNGQKSEILLGVVGEWEKKAEELAYTNQSYTTELRIGHDGTFYDLDVEIKMVHPRQLSKKQRAELMAMSYDYRDVRVLYQRLKHDVLKRRFGTGRKPKEDC